MIKIKISKDFSNTPGGRLITEGPNSGEQFRNEILEPKYIEAKEKGEKILIDLDDCYGFPISFLEESFGGLARKYPKDNIIKIIEIKSEDQPSLIEKIKQYIREANK